MSAQQCNHLAAYESTLCAVQGCKAQQKEVVHDRTGPDSASHQENPLYIRGNVSPGQHVEHNGTVVVLGDVEPDATVHAGADVLVLGR